ncbi:conserved hypothetical protein [Talaromyces marneffei ATCC 18224]|uniref:Bacteriophage T5 Orf172 DNA-binding domain-containing protein n=2 Tax=Talaromyces marneffei TaxID=37727 RepID=B6QFZ3_TALMQ|nr:conserved hypothetical protein [Talaromyces marneffei ATCC 18224]
MYSHITENAFPPDCGGAWYCQPEQAAHSLALFQYLTGYRATHCDIFIRYSACSLIVRLPYFYGHEKAVVVVEKSFKTTLRLIIGMPQSANTPELILPRSDSRNPSSTCRGITVNGKPCRRTLAASTKAAATPKGVVAMLKGHQQLDPTVFYCWQHKSQAPQPADNSIQRKKAQIVAVGRKSSIDSLVERLGILEVNDSQRQQRRATERSARNQGAQSSRNERRHQKQQSSFCCFTIVDESYNMPATKRVTSSSHVYSQEKPVSTRPPTTSQRPVFVRDPRSRNSPVIQQRSAPVTPRRWSESQQATPRSSDRSQYLGTPTRPSLPSTPNSYSSQTRPLLSLIPEHLSPQTTALLLTELSKPISDADEEGYIYIFWVTPQKPDSMEAPPGDIALNLLPPPGRPNHSRRTSDALRAAQSIDPRSKGSAGQPGTIRLKIGRTSNVHRRLNEWSKQCSHNLTLIRYYPYTNSSPSPSPSPARRSDSGHSQGHSRRVPHAHRVERLIHIELADQRAKGEGPCAQCKKEHREWFEFTATKDALKLVDDCVRRWVAWGEQHT